MPAFELRLTVATVKRIWKIFLVGFLVLLALLIVGGIWAHQWLHSPAVHAQVESELSRALKMPVKIESLSINLFGPVTVKGIRVPQGNGNFFSASGFTSRHRVSALFGGRLVFDFIHVEAPQFVFLQDSQGKWNIPHLPEEVKTNEHKDSHTRKERSPGRVEIKRLIIDNGSAQALNVSGKTLGLCNGISIRLSDVQPDSLEGNVVIGRVEYSDYAHLDQIKAAFSRTTKKGIIIPSFSALAGGGKLEGGFARKPDKDHPWSLRISLTDVDSSTALAPEFAEKSYFSGLVSGNIELRGQDAGVKSLNGKYDVSVRDGAFRDMQLVQEIGVLLGLNDFSDFRIRDARLNGLVGRERVFVEKISVSAEPLFFSGTGYVKFDGKLTLDGKMAVDQNLLKDRQNLEAQFSQPDNEGKRSVNFQMRGSLKKPKSNLMEQITGTDDRSTQRLILAEDLLKEIQQGNEPEPAPPSAPQTPEKP